MDVRQLLSASDRQWRAVDGASDADLGRLAKASPVALPESLIDLLRFSNGGTGELALPPLLFELDSVENIIDGINDPFVREVFPNFVFFGGNGGLERIAIDFRRDAESWPIVMIDPIAGPDSAEIIAPNIEALAIRMAMISLRQ